MKETWYVMEDGAVGDPRAIAMGDDGLLRHRDGRAVAYAPHGPRSRGGVDAEAERAKAEAGEKPAEKPAKPAAKVTPDKVTSEVVAEAQPAPAKRTYKTRD